MIFINHKKGLPKIYYCRKCDRYTDVRYTHDKLGGRPKSKCYKCGEEMLEPVYVKNEI
jgi:NAD-dependent SIR2 family protein deacetylase